MFKFHREHLYETTAQQYGRKKHVSLHEVAIVKVLTKRFALKFVQI